jgi:hypothetical protein
METSFYQAYFTEVAASQPLDESLGNEAQKLAEQYGKGVSPYFSSF